MKITSQMNIKSNIPPEKIIMPSSKVFNLKDPNLKEKEYDIFNTIKTMPRRSRIHRNHQTKKKRKRNKKIKSKDI